MEEVALVTEGRPPGRQAAEKAKLSKMKTRHHRLLEAKGFEDNVKYALFFFFY
jgi:hypothetical protein